MYTRDMTALRFVFSLFDRFSGPARRIRDSLAGVRRELGRTRLHFNALYDQTAGLRTLAIGFGAAWAGGVLLMTGAMSAYAVAAAAFKEQAETSFQVLLGSKKAGTDLYNQAVRFAAMTPFSTQQVIDSYQKLLGFGFKPVEIPIVLSGIGDLASIKGFSQEAVSRIIIAMGQIRAKGRLMGQEMLQLAEAGFSQANFYQIVSKKMGVSINEVRKLQEAGKISSQMALWGILETIRTTNSGGKLGNLMKQQSQTLKGLWSTLASRPFEMLQYFDATGAFKDIKAVVKNLGDAFDVATPRGKKLSAALIKLNDLILGGIFGPLADVTGAGKIEQTVNTVTRHIEQFGQFWAAFWPQAVLFFRGFITGVQAGWTQVLKAYNAAKPFIDGLSSFIGKLTGAKDGAVSTAEALGRIAGFMGVMAVAAGGLSVLLIPIRLLLWFADVLYSVWKIGAGFVRTIGQIIALGRRFRAWGGVGRILSGIGTRFIAAGVNVAGFGSTVMLWAARLSTAGGPFAWFAPVAARVGSLLVSLGAQFGSFGGGIAGLLGRIAGLGGSILPFFASIWGWITATIPALWSAITAFLGGIATAIGGVLGAISPVGWVIIIVTAVVGVFTWAYFQFEGFRKLVDDVWDAIKWGAGEAASYITTKIIDFTNAGAALIDGLKNGILSGWNGLKDTLTNTGNSVAEWFKQSLGISSPSRTFNDFGGFIVDGLLTGIQTGQSRITSTVKGLAGFLREAWMRYAPNLTPSFGGVGGGGTGAGGAGVAGAGAVDFSGLAAKSNSTIAKAAIDGISSGWAESLPGYCSRFVRQVFGRALGPATNRLFGSSAIETENNFKRAGLAKSLAQIGGLGGLKAGDVLFQGYGSGGFGHTGVYVGNGQVAHNTTMGKGGKMISPLSAFGGITSVGRVPAPAPKPSAPAPAARKNGPQIVVNNALTVPKGTPSEQAKKLKADAHSASYQGAALALERLAVQGGHA